MGGEQCAVAVSLSWVGDRLAQLARHSTVEMIALSVVAYWAQGVGQLWEQGVGQLWEQGVGQLDTGPSSRWAGLIVWTFEYGTESSMH